MKQQDIKRIINEHDIEFIQIEIVDLNGVSRSVITPTENFLENVESGTYHAPSPINVFQITGDLVNDTGAGFEVDALNIDMKPDLETFKVLHWIENTASVTCDVSTTKIDLEYWQLSCRQQCKAQLQKLEQMGLRMYSAFEYEFYLVDKDTMQSIYKDVNFAATSLVDIVRPVVYDIMRNLRKVGIKPEIYEAEFGPAQQEITMVPEFGIKSTDNAILYKQVVKAIAKKHDLKALFLSKPFAEESGSSSHFNHSLWDLSKKSNAFYDAEQPDKMSQVFKSWLAGIQEHTKALAALFCITTNCFERCKLHTFAPTNDSWGYDNRTVGFRIKNDSPSYTYLENRIPGAGSNPYLVMTGCLIAGMDGIKRNLQLKSKPYSGNLYEAKELPEGVENLPGSLEEAVQHLQDDKILSGELGEVFMKAFTAIKKHDVEKWDKVKNSASKWEQYRNDLGLYL